MSRPFGNKNKKTVLREMGARQNLIAYEIDTTVSLDALAVLEEVMAHFYFKAKTLKGAENANSDAVDRAMSEAGRWAKEAAQYRHAKIQAIRLAEDRNAPLLPEHMTLDQLRESIVDDYARLVKRGYLPPPATEDHEAGQDGSNGGQDAPD
jgi:hypothetical protein